jgi:hypothetical protein
MDGESNGFLKKKAVNGWVLFRINSCLISVVMIVGMAIGDLSSGPGVSSMIQLSARCAVPWLYLAFAASSLHVVFSSHFSAWLLRNRKYFGLSFAVSMGWQAIFIVWMVSLHTDYYVDEVYLLRDLIEGLLGYAFLFLMVVTSFRPGRKLLSRKQWKLLHKSGIYFLWAYAFSVYWWAIFFNQDPVFIDYLFYWIGFLAWGVRAAAWQKDRRKAVANDASPAGSDPSARLAGIAIAGLGVTAATFGSAWRGTTDELLYGYALTRIPELYLPYWPFEPFLPLAVVALGTYMVGTSWHGRVRPSTA